MPATSKPGRRTSQSRRPDTRLPVLPAGSGHGHPVRLRYRSRPAPRTHSLPEALASTSGSFKFEFENFGWGGDWYRAHGEMMPADGLDALRHKDAILFGSAGDPHIPDHITLWGLRLKICQGFDQYANVRPARILPGTFHGGTVESAASNTRRRAP